MGTITCIPKGGKLRNDLKNWRPLTLLNCTYKYLSSMIADRIKSVLEELISNDQTGFISNRFLLVRIQGFCMILLTIAILKTLKAF